ncbi:hypothetical protein SNK04_014166 [Fusarium graminearum]
MSGLTPANSCWFELDVDGETPDDKRYLDNAAETIWLNIHQSNFDAEGYEACLDTVAAGWFAPMWMRTVSGGYSFEQCLSLASTSRAADATGWWTPAIASTHARQDRRRDLRIGEAERGYAEARAREAGRAGLVHPRH